MSRRPPPVHFASAALDALSANLAILNENGVIVTVNRAWVEFAGANGGGDDVGTNYLHLCDAAVGDGAAHAHAVAAGIRAVLAGQAMFELEYPCHSETEQRYYVARVTAFRQDGECYALVAHENITRRKLAELEVISLNVTLEARVRERTVALEASEQALQRTNAELIKRNDELSQFVYVASHDLQEPLRILGAYADILRHRYRGQQLDERADTYLLRITQQVDRARQLVRDVLTLSDVAPNPPREPTDLAAICCEVRDSLPWPSDGRVECGADLPQASANPAQVRQLLANLLGNALKFRSAAPLHVQLSGNPEQDRVHFVLRDNGIGIAPQHADKVFVLFQRLHSRKSVGGNGIGLAVCRRIVERHGGRIWIEAVPGAGGGTAVHFTLPSLQAPTGDPALASSQGTAAERPSPGS
ncbi:sensor histidine kinase [Deinococcus aerophilus]|uniref:histidine kinase n=1 Tax=Deinococcus aerophilus TaxID=522488 RepID=A0ABQ2GJY8_9DEIO|nr:ATP-binding protein [Deinococcus aerophilus]GGL98997.1 hypothetical protein GCM10010841_04310 [Deinococcus aerophilus]